MTGIHIIRSRERDLFIFAHIIFYAIYNVNIFNIIPFG